MSRHVGDKKALTDHSSVRTNTKKPGRRQRGDHDTDLTGTQPDRSIGDGGVGAHSMHSFSVHHGHRGAVYENTYRMEPDMNHAFDSNRVRKIVEGILNDSLSEVVYDPDNCRHRCQELTTQITERIKELKMRRYKIVTIVNIGGVKDRPGVMFGSRCLWSQSTDTYSTVKFANLSLYAVAMVYGLYYE